MISTDSVRAAMQSDKPWSRLDEIVRAELAAGRTTKQIAEEWRRIADEVRSTPGLPEDGDDAFLDTLDALTGNCHSDYCYKDPPTLPSEEEIAELPRWARVAFAARCARRVLPLFGLHRPGAGQETRRVLQLGVGESETAAATAGGDLLKLATLVQELGKFDTATVGAAYFSATAAVAASTADGGTQVTENVQEAMRWAALLDNGTSAGSNAASLFIRRDFDYLARLAHWQQWTDDTPVPPDVFGPLWPEGPPPGWPADPDVPQRTDLPLELLSRARDPERMTADEAVNLFNAINAYYIARTGDRLTVEDLRPLVAAAVPAGV